MRIGHGFDVHAFGGAVLTILTFLVHITLGVWWWNMLIGWNML